MSLALQRWIDRLEHLGYRGNLGLRIGRALRTPSSVRVVRHTVLLRHYPTTTRPLRIAFATDFHAGPTTDPRLLADALAALQAARADLILLGGDFISLVAEDIDPLVPHLAQLEAPLGKYAVLGNHDHWTSARYLERSLSSAGIELLTNRNVGLPPPFEGTWICGLDDHWLGRPDPASAFAGASGVRILLMHAPSGLLDLEGQRFDLALCGHTHGGQIALPCGIPLLVPHGPLSRKYVRGRFEVNGGTMIVSVGVGCSILPVRVFVPPEILICEVGSG